MTSHGLQPGLDQLPRVWAVGTLVQAVAGLVREGFGAVAVRGEISGFKRAASGHCYFSLKDEGGQLRCALFRRAAALLSFAPRDGDQVLLRGRLSVYEGRGDLQLIVESMERAGQGALFEQFLRLKARLEAEGLFDAGRKRPLPEFPRGVAVVTSLGAAALHDVLSTLARRVPQMSVLLVPAAVQGPLAPGQLRAALERAYACARQPQAPSPVDLILLVRGGGALEDLWAFNDEQLARTVACSPVPVICGVGHETDFTIADFVADLRAPTPTAAAELVDQPRAQRLTMLEHQAQRLQRGLHERLDAEAQHLDALVSRLSRPSAVLAQQRLRLVRHGERLRSGGLRGLETHAARLQGVASRLPRALLPALDGAGRDLRLRAERLQRAAQEPLRQSRQRLQDAALRLDLLDPHLVLERGYAWVEDKAGQPLVRASQVHSGQALDIRFADGVVAARASEQDRR